LTSRTGAEEGAQGPHGLPHEALARQLLADAAGVNPSPEALATSGERVYLQLRARFTVLFGASGFDALWARAVYLALRDLRPGEAHAAKAAPAGTYGLHAAVRGRDAAAAPQIVEAVFARFVTLLFTFIGEDLGSRFLRQLWPDPPPDVAGSRAEEPTP
jgi:hypothetical protein